VAESIGKSPQDFLQ